MEKLNSFGERLLVGGAEVGRRMSAGMSSVSGKMKELLQTQTAADKIVEEATTREMQEPDWAANLRICDALNSGKLPGQDVVRAIKKRLAVKNPVVQYLALVLLETCAMNCDKVFSEIASEKVLEEMVNMIDDSHTIPGNRNKVLQLIQAWGESGNDLRYLPVFEETYKSLKSRGLRFPRGGNEDFPTELVDASAQSFASPTGYPASVLDQQEGYSNVFVPQSSILSEEQRKEVLDVARNSNELLSTVLSSSPQQEALEDDLTSTLVQQCRQSQITVQRLVESAGENESFLCEALNVNDEIQRVLSKYEEMLKVLKPEPAHVSEPASIPVHVEEQDLPQAAHEEALVRNHIPKSSNTPPRYAEDAAMADLDDMIFGRKSGKSGEHDSQKDEKSLI
uniref:VHS domain-containing protein n=1 Tax=Araucaria cunninghamii TaxID=56994 RepID=A0A0D6QZC3_ARACU